MASREVKLPIHLCIDTDTDIVAWVQALAVRPNRQMPLAAAIS
jgi:hypothetical protein